MSNLSLACATAYQTISPTITASEITVTMPSTYQKPGQNGLEAVSLNLNDIVFLIIPISYNQYHLNGGNGTYITSIEIVFPFLNYIGSYSSFSYTTVGNAGYCGYGGTPFTKGAGALGAQADRGRCSELREEKDRHRGYPARSTMGVREPFNTAVMDVPYDASPVAMATRRMDNGGLGDKRNMVHQATRTDFPLSSGGAGLGEIELTVENVTPFQFPAGGDTSLAQVVEEGRKEYKQPYPRPFIAGTQGVAVSSGAARRALKDGLRRRGF